MFSEHFIRQAIIAAPAILFALTVHEFFHAWTAFRFGDSTARDAGRLTLNPLAHLDLFGTLMMFLSQFRFGWAKPVPVNPYNLRGNVRMADFWISAAGPLSNLGLAFVFGMIFRAVATNSALPEPFYLLLFYSVMINTSLAFFNLIPLYPLDGSHMLRGILPERFDPAIDQFERVSPFILIGLILVGGFWFILGPLVTFFVRLFSGVPLG